MGGTIKSVLHVTEALGGGVVNLISQLAGIQSSDGLDVTVAHSIRPDTPADAELELLFPQPVRRRVVPMVTQISPKSDLRAVLILMRLFRQIKPDVIHLHSSKAGVLGRVAARLAGYGGRAFYSPHGFSFLRQDVSEGKRRLFLGFEKAAARLGGTLIASSATEADLAREKLMHPKVVLVENSIALEKVLPKCSGGDKARVVTVGRVCYPKAPRRFRDLALGLSEEEAEFVWIGDGELKHELLVEGRLPDNLSVTGWQDREFVLGQLSSADIFVLLSLWEGMPLALIEAQASGLPAVVTDVVGCRDVVRNGQTGFVCGSMEEVVEKVRLLIRDAELGMAMGERARAMARERFSVERMHREMVGVYGFDSPG